MIWVNVAVAIAFTSARTVIRYHVSNRLFAEDGCVYFALAILICIAIMYQLIIPIMFEIDLVVKGVLPTAGFPERATYFLKLQFAIIVLFWTALWAVKFSFLFFYRQLLTRLPDQMRWWKALTLFTILAYLGAWITQLLSCQPISHYFKLGVVLSLLSMSTRADCVQVLATVVEISWSLILAFITQQPSMLRATS